MLRHSTVLALLISSPFATANDNWPHWRGPTVNGVADASATPPLKWNTETNVKWKVPLPGRGSATPIVWGDRLYVVTAIKTDREATPEEMPKPDPRFQTRTKPPTHFYKFDVLCLDRNTGKIIWQKTLNEAVPHEGHHETHSYAAGSPTTDGKRLYVSFGSFGIFALDLDGNVQWKRDFGRLHTRLGWGEAVTPVVHGDSLFLNWDQEGAGDSKLICLDAATGKTNWETKRDEKSSWNTPCVVEHAGRTQVIVNAENRIRSYDAKDGSDIWQAGGMTANPIPSPLCANGIAFVMSGYRGNAAVAISLDAMGDLGKDGPTLWRYGKGTPYVSSPILVGNRLYFTQALTNVMTILDARTGKPILADERLPGLGQIYASPLAAAGRIYFTDRQGTTVVIKAGDELEVLATNKLNDPIDASPVAVGKTLYLRGEKFLYAIEEK
jgi:outer membrane protein assembly factor BamB